MRAANGGSCRVNELPQSLAPDPGEYNALVVCMQSSAGSEVVQQAPQASNHLIKRRAAGGAGRPAVAAWNTEAKAVAHTNADD